MKKTLVLPLILSATLVGAGAAWAQSASTQPVMGFGQIAEALQGQGYQDIREIEREGEKLYEVKARDAQGQRVELYVDGRTGEVLKSERKGRRD